MAAKATAKELYVKLMDSVRNYLLYLHLKMKITSFVYYLKKQFGACKPFIGTEILEKHHRHIKSYAIETFRRIKKLGSLDIGLKYLHDLNQELDNLSLAYLKNNQTKKNSQSTRTPFTLICLIFVTYFLSGLFRYFWLGFISFLFLLLFYASCLSLIFWLYAKFKGEYKELIALFDLIVLLIWENLKVFNLNFIKTKYVYKKLNSALNT